MPVQKRFIYKCRTGNGEMLDTCATLHYNMLVATQDCCLSTHFIEATPMYMKKPYDPNKQYFMLDYFDKTQIAWCRLPYLTLEEVSDRILLLASLGTPIKNLRVLPETYLDEKREAEFNEEKQEYVEDTITNREYFFDSRYEDISQRYKAKALANA